MKLGLGLFGSGATFRMASLFAGGEDGIVIDRLNPSSGNLFQDAAGTTPVTAAGQPVGRVLDASGNGNHATQPINDDYRPTLMQDAGGRYYLQFDGVDDYLVTGNIDLTSTNKVSVFAGVRKLSDAVFAILTEFSVNAGTQTGAFAITAPSGSGTPTYQFLSRGTAAGSANYNNALVAAPSSNVAVGLGDISGDSAKLRVDGLDVATSLADQGTGSYGNYPLYIGSRAGTSSRFNGRLYGLCVLGREATATEIDKVERHLATKSGVTL